MILEIYLLAKKIEKMVKKLKGKQKFWYPGKPYD